MVTLFTDIFGLSFYSGMLKTCLVKTHPFILIHLVTQLKHQHRTPGKMAEITREISLALLEMDSFHLNFLKVDLHMGILIINVCNHLEVVIVRWRSQMMIF